MARSADIRVGISGWRYEPWRGTFYPEGLVQKRELEYASRKLNSVEINGSFYSLQRPKDYRNWYEQTPADFVFAVKGGRYITHMRRLRDVEKPLANFLASGVLRLEEKLGPILWQFPPQFRFDEEKFARFFEMLPRTTGEASKVAKGHDAWMKGRAWTEVSKVRPLRHAVEIRHESFKEERFVRLLRKHGVGLVFADTAGKWPYMEDVTADFIYARLHGEEELYVSGYTDEALDWWADRLRAWGAGREPGDRTCVLSAAAKKCKARDVYVFFDNDVKVRAPFDAMALYARLTGGTVEQRGPAKVVPELARTSWPGVRRARAARRRTRKAG
jgi:uncharacterized protein YecE (DUF72 family)